jgi:hypothetical protein
MWNIRLWKRLKCYIMFCTCAILNYVDVRITVIISAGLAWHVVGTLSALCITAGCITDWREHTKQAILLSSCHSRGLLLLSCLLCCMYVFWFVYGKEILQYHSSTSILSALFHPNCCTHRTIVLVSAFDQLTTLCRSRTVCKPVIRRTE